MGSRLARSDLHDVGVSGYSSGRKNGLVTWGRLPHAQFAWAESAGHKSRNGKLKQVKNCFLVRPNERQTSEHYIERPNPHLRRYQCPLSEDAEQLLSGQPLSAQVPQ